MTLKAQLSVRPRTRGEAPYGWPSLSLVPMKLLEANCQTTGWSQNTSSDGLNIAFAPFQQLSNTPYGNSQAVGAELLASCSMHSRLRASHPRRS